MGLVEFDAEQGMLMPGQGQATVAPSGAGECSSRCHWVCSDVPNRQNLPHLSMVQISTPEETSDNEEQCGGGLRDKVCGSAWCRDCFVG